MYVLWICQGFCRTPRSWVSSPVWTAPLRWRSCALIAPACRPCPPHSVTHVHVSRACQYTYLTHLFITLLFTVIHQNNKILQLATKKVWVIQTMNKWWEPYASWDHECFKCGIHFLFRFVNYYYGFIFLLSDIIMLFTLLREGSKICSDFESVELLGLF